MEAREVDHHHSQRLITATSDALGALFAEGSQLDTLQQALATIADAVEADRISLLEYEVAGAAAGARVHHRFDWRREDPEALYNDPDTANIALDASYRFWSQPMLGDDLIVTQTAEAETVIRARLEAWNVQTVVSSPIALAAGFRGALNFVHKRNVYAWSPEQLAVIRTVSCALTAACLRYDTDTHLAASQDLSREAFDNATIGMVVLSADAIMLEVNVALCALLGYEREELIGQSTLMITHPDDVAQVVASRPNMRSLKITDAERRFVRADGELVWTQLNISPLRTRIEGDPPGAPAFVAYIRDTTTIRQAGLIAELERSNRELEEFAYIASHDLQEPLRMITSYLELIQRRYADKLDEDANEFIDFAVDGATRMRALVTSLLIYSRLDSGPTDYAPVSLSATLEHALQPLRLLIEENDARITYDDLPLVTGNEAQLTQVFQNLIENAIKFRQAGPPEIRVSATRGLGFWTISVEDNGIGFDATQAERIFGVFRRLHRYGRYPGTGIGLAICKRIVERHGGAIKAFSEVSKGSTFQFTLPIVNA